MKTRYEYIHFKILELKPKTKVWGVFDNKDVKLMAVIKWYGPWRRYCLFPENFLIPGLSLGNFYDINCLRDIVNFMEEITRRHKNKKKPEEV